MPGTGSEAGMMNYLRDNHNHALHHHPMGDGNAIDHDELVNDDNGGDEFRDGDVPDDPGNQSENHGGTVSIETNSQLTLSFQGQVYVFDPVSPDKVSFFTET